MSDRGPAGRPQVESRPSRPDDTVTLHDGGSKSPPPANEPDIGARWDDFELMAEIGRGGMGIVYRARQVSLEREVAIKVMLRGDAMIASRLRREARVLAQVDSPHVVRAYTAGIYRQQPYLVMEFIEGIDLSRKLKDGWKPNALEALDLIAQAARGLSAATKHGIIHRDVKPANMMLTPESVVKLTDFGLAHMSNEEALTNSGAVIGTTHYTSPEQGRGGACDPRSDIYSLGVVLYQLLTGELPFVGETPAAVIYQHIHAYPKSPRRLSTGIPRSVERIVLKCLRKSPADRYQNAEELIADCEAVAQGKDSNWSPRSALSALLLSAVLVTGVWALARSGEKAEAPDEPVSDPVPFTLPIDEPTSENDKPVAPQPVIKVPRGLSAAARDEHGIHADLVLAGLTQRFRYCPPGSFKMGSPAYETGRRDDETAHEVELTRGFWLADSECTQAFWRIVSGDQPSSFSGDDLPVNRVSRTTCETFLKRLNQRVRGLRARLPTEAEWEYACRAGTLDPFAGLSRMTPDSAAFGRSEPCAVKSFAPNQWGFYDMLGNVREWCFDAYGPLGEQPASDPLKSGSGDGVSRGGCWEDGALECRAARRWPSWVDADQRSIGLRLALDAVDER